MIAHIPTIPQDVCLFEPTTIGIIATSLVVSIGVSYLAAKLAKKRSRSTIEDSKPTVLADRGAYIPWVVGRRRIGYVFAWAGNRFSRKEKVSGGKGSIIGGSEKVKIWYEEGVHVLCVGIGWKLWAIRGTDGYVWVGPITRDSHPSGTTVDAGKKGSFTIYWGELDQPVNTSLGDASRLGISSRWPGIMYVQWNERRLGTTPIWEFMDYEVEVDFENAPTLPSDPYDPPELVDSLTDPIFGPHDVYEAFDGAPGAAQVVIIGYHDAVYNPGLTFRLTGNTADGDYEVLSSARSTRDGGLTKVTEVTLNDTLSGTDDNGTTKILAEANDGYSPVHIVYRMLFHEFPFGLGLDAALFDEDELEALVTLVRDESIKCSVLAIGGETARSVLGKLMMDLGLFLNWDATLGRYVLTAFREKDVIQLIPDDAVMAPLPERTKLTGPKKRDKLLFRFADNERSFRDNVITIDADEQGNLEGHQKTTTIELSAVTNYDSAASIAERRSQEELARPQGVNVYANRATRLLLPGEKISLGPDYTEFLRVVGVKLEHLTAKVVLACVTDFYGLPVTIDAHQQGGGTDTNLFPPQDDEAADVFEVPAYLTTVQLIGVMSIRAHGQIATHGVNLSVDDVTYTRVDTDDGVQSGGTLDAEMDVGRSYLAQGPEITLLGVDDEIFQDLTLDEANWRAGRQWAVVDEEIMFVQKVTALGGSTYRLDGVLRARYDTEKAVHAAGTPVFIFNSDDLLTLNDILLSPGVTLYTKIQPETASESLPLADVEAVSRTLVGKGVVPMKPLNLRTARTQGRTLVYETGDDIDFEWAYRSSAVAGTGAGMQNAGTPTGTSPIQGEFLLEIKTTGDVLKRSFPSITTTSQTYTNAQLIADFAGEPASFKAVLRNVNGGYQSPEVEVAVTKL